MALIDGKTQQEYYDSDNYGGYQFISLDDIINQFMAIYVGPEKIISKASRVDVAFHAQRAVQELSFDTFKSIGSQELEVPATLTVPLPHDYVNYTQISWSDGSGIKHRLYPASKTSNPTNYYQNDDKDYSFTITATLSSGNTSIVLDDIYTNIEIGARVSGQIIDTIQGSYGYPPENGWFVRDISTTSGVTTLTVFNGDIDTPEYLAPFYTGDETITITNPGGTPILNKESGVTIGDSTTNFNSSTPWTVDEYTITAASGVDISEVKIGMHVQAYPSFPAAIPSSGFLNTKVVDINGQVITVDQACLLTASSVVSVYFTSNESFSDTWDKYKSTTPSENSNDDYEDDTYWPLDGERYGLSPQHAQANGSFYIDEKTGKIHFSSNISGKTVIIDYISDGLYTEAYDLEMLQPESNYPGAVGKRGGYLPRVYKSPIIHKFAEEALYKWIAYGIISGRTNVSEAVVQRLKRERFAETRKAKLRLSNIKLEELTQILRGKSKWIKH